jgi:hypothetical protein
VLFVEVEETVLPGDPIVVQGASEIEQAGSQLLFIPRQSRHGGSSPVNDRSVLGRVASGLASMNAVLVFFSKSLTSERKTSNGMRPRNERVILGLLMLDWILSRKDSMEHWNCQEILGVLKILKTKQKHVVIKYLMENFRPASSSFKLF